MVMLLIIAACGSRPLTRAQNESATRASREDKGPTIGAPAANAPCSIAARERARARALFAQGKLSRSLHVLANANAQCAIDRASGWDVELSALSAIGRTADACALAETIDASANAPLRAKQVVVTQRRTLEEECRRRNSDAGGAASSADESRDESWANAESDETSEVIASQHPEDKSACGTCTNPVACSSAERDSSRSGGATPAPMERLPRYKRYLLCAKRGHDDEKNKPYKLAKQLALRAWELARPQPMALFIAADSARLDNDPIEAQRLYDRAMVELESGRGAITADAAESAASPGAVAYAGSAKQPLVAVAEGKEILLLDRSTRDVRAHLRGHRGIVRVLAASSDGEWLASGGTDGSVRVWRVASGEARWVLVGADVQRDSDVAINAIAFSPRDNSLLAAACSDNVVRVWDLHKGEQTHSFKHDMPALSVAFSPNGRQLASGTGRIEMRGSIDDVGGVGKLHLWDLDAAAGSGRDSRPADTAKEKPKPSTDSPHEGQRAAPAAAVRAEVSGDRGRGVSPQHDQAVTAVAFSAKGDVLASGSLDTKVKLWNLAGDTLKLRSTIPTPSPITALLLLPDGVLVTGHVDGALRFPSAASPASAEHVARGAKQPSRGGRKTGPTTRRGAVRSLSFSSGELASNGDDGTVRFWDAKRRLEIASRLIEVHAPAIDMAAVSPDARSIAMHLASGEVLLFDASGERLRLVPLGRDSGDVTALAFSPDKKTLAIAREDAIDLWDASTLTLARSIHGGDGRQRWMAFSPDGTMLATTRDGGVLVLRSVATGDPLSVITVPGSRALSFEFGAGGKSLTCASHDGVVRTWDVITGQRTRIMETHELELAAPLAAALSPDLRLLAVAPRRGEALRVLDPATGNQLQEFAGLDDDVNALAFAPDSRVLTASMGDGGLGFFSIGAGTPTLALRAVRIDSKDALKISLYARTPDGFVDFLETARDALVCGNGSEVPLSIELCEERYRVPGLVAKVLAGDVTFRDP